MGDFSDASFALSDDDRVELNDRMSLGDDVRCDLRAQRQLLSDVRRGVITNFAADVNPRAKEDILYKGYISQAQDLAWMR